jgi:hypothetical protein
MGAVVRAFITLRHWKIGSKEEGVAGRDSYAADIDSIRVIVAAPPFLGASSSVHKHKIMSTDPGSIQLEENPSLRSVPVLFNVCPID